MTGSRTTRRVAVAVTGVAFLVASVAPAVARPARNRPEPAPAAAPESRQLIVKFKPRASAAARLSTRADLRLRLAERLPLTGAEVVTAAPGTDPAALAEALNGDPDVEYAEPNRLWLPTSNDPHYDKLWGLENTGQTIAGRAGTPGVDIAAPAAWRTTRGDPEVVVAVIDSGVDIDHPDLAARIWTNPGEIAGNGQDDDGNGYPDDVHGWDFYNDDATVFDPEQGDEHGTHVAGTIAAETDNGIGVAGVAPQVTIMPLKFLGPDGGWTTDAIEAIEYATEQGVRISNNSWGGVFEPDDALRDAIRTSGQAFIAAAGNSGTDLDAEGAVREYPASYNLANILSVAAVNNRGGLARFSNYGDRSVDVGGPGVAVWSTVPKRSALTTAAQIGTAVYDAMFWGFGLEDVAGQSDRAAILHTALSHLGATAGSPILLVDDDESPAADRPDMTGFYTAALQDSGYTNVEVHDVATDGRPQLGAGTIVIWQTGDGGLDLRAPLNAGDLEELAAFLDGGGRLLLAGPDALIGREDSDFVKDHLHLRWPRDHDQFVEAHGADGSVYAGADFTLSGVDNSYGDPSPYRDVVVPVGPAAIPALIYPGEADYSAAYDVYAGTSMAAPHAAGVAALVASMRPNATARGLVNRLKTTAVPLHSLAKKTSTGGMVNAAAAVAPDPVRALDATAGINRVRLTWTNPSNAHFSGVVVRMRRGTTPPTASNGSVVYRGTGTSVVKRGLHPGRTYSFSVFAHDHGPNYSRAAVARLLGTRLTVGSSPARLTKGREATITGRLTRAGTRSGLAGRPVEVQVRKRGAARWRRLATVTSARRGTIRFRHKPAWNAQYRLQFPGAGRYLGRRSGTTAVAVRPRVTARLSTTQVRLGGTAALAGSVAPPHARQVVELQRLIDRKWNTVARRRLSRRSTYRFRVRPRWRGVHRYRVRKPGDHDHLPGWSAGRRLRVS